MPWDYDPTPEFDAWFDDLSQADTEHVAAAIRYLCETGPMARFPMSYPIKQPNSCEMKELRPASTGRSEIRILYAFDFRRQAILLLGGDKAGQWDSWYDRNVPIADSLFAAHVKKRKEEAAEAAKSAKRSTKPTRRGRRKR